jgi:hypothetical protein
LKGSEHQKLTLINKKEYNATTYNSVDIRGVAAEPIIEEILSENKTIAEDLVTFETDIKAETIHRNITQQYCKPIQVVSLSAGSLVALIQ